MKRSRKLLTWLVVLCMVLTMFPIQAMAEGSAAQLRDYGQFLEKLEVLETSAAAYAAQNPGKDPVGLLIRYIRTGVPGCNTAYWSRMAGYEDPGFAEYAAQQAGVADLKNLGTMTLPNGETAELGYLFGVLDIAWQNRHSAAHGDAAGWAGELVELMVLADGAGLNGDVEQMTNTIRQNYLMDGDHAARIRLALDGWRMVDALESADYETGLFGKIFRETLSAQLTDAGRASWFLQNRLGGVTNRGDIREAVFTAYTSNPLTASLESEKTFAAGDLSDIRRASCYAFADRLCQLAGDYVELGENRYYSVISSQKTTLVPGITQETLKAKTSDNKQIVYYLATADVASPYISVYANYRDNDPGKGWGMQSVRDQVQAAEARHSDPDSDLYIPNYQVVASVNGAGYNMTTGEPGGLLIMGGVEYHAPNANGFFGILKDGSAYIGTTQEYKDLKAQGLVMEGISIFGATLVKDGKLAVGHSDSHINNRASRTAVGITKTGKVVFMVLDGRQEPVSCGGSMQEIAQIMLDAGCVEAVNLDGGGSTTMIARKPGETEHSLINKPSDGFERKVSTSLIMVSTLPGEETPDHAVLSADADCLTVGAQVTVTAACVSAAGTEVAVPKAARWQSADPEVADISESGVLTGRKNGTVEVRLVQGDQILGKKTFRVVVPDGVYFENPQMNADAGRTVTLPVAATYGGKRVAITPADITLTLSNANAGSLSGFTFTAKADSGVRNVTLTATAAGNPAATGTMLLTLYGQGEPSFDFNTALGSRQLAWNRQVSNATTEDGLTYRVENIGSAMESDYTFAMDLSALPIPQAQAKLVSQQLGLQSDNEMLLLDLAEHISAMTELRLVIAFDGSLSVRYEDLELISDLFTLADAQLDSETNELTLRLKWKEQAARLDLETTSTVCILRGLRGVPGAAVLSVQNSQSLSNSARLELELWLKGDALKSLAESHPDQGLVPYENGGETGCRLDAMGDTFPDAYTLVKEAKNGWLYEDGGYAYYVQGQRLTGVKKAGEYYYDFGDSGINLGQTKYTGLFLEDGLRHYAKDGSLASGWYIQGDDHYCFDENGLGYDGSVVIDEVELTFANGLQTGGHTGFVKKTNGATYCYENGQMVYGWHYVGQDLYHFNTNDGRMTTGTHVIPDEEASAKGAYYDFAPDGKTLRGYFNGFGYYYWAGAPRRDDWVKSGADPDPDAWYHTNGNGHFVTDATGKETFPLELDGKTYTAVKIAYDGVVYTFDNTNGKLLLGNFAMKDGKWYFFWAGQPIKTGWFEKDGKTYYADPEDGHLATGSKTIDGETYMFTSQGVLVKEGVILTGAMSQGSETMTVKLSGAPGNLVKVRVAVWAVNAGQSATLRWIDLEKTGEGQWQVIVPMCEFGMQTGDTFALHVYATAETERFLVDTTVEVAEAVGHAYSAASCTEPSTCTICGKTLGTAKGHSWQEATCTAPRTCETCGATEGDFGHVYNHDYDESCNVCGQLRQVPQRPVVHMFRMYDPNSGEHFYTGSEEERDNLIAVGWNYEGVGFTFPLTTGDPVYRLYDPVTGEHLYTMDVAEKEALMAAGWNYEGIAFNSGFSDEVPQYRLHNPNATRGAYHFTASDEERDFLLSLGWEYQGIGWYSCWK